MNYGKIVVIIGPMFSGKTSEMIRRITRCKIAGKKTVIVYFKLDTIKNTHDSLRTKKGLRTEKLMDVFEDCKKYDVIGIDEGQFYQDLIEFCESLRKLGKLVIVAGLDGDFRKEPFGQMCNIIAKAKNVKKLNAVCMNCKKNDAPFNHRISNEKDIKVVGGSDKYIACCGPCYDKLTLDKKKSWS